MDEYPTCHAVVVGEQPHEGCDVCSLLAVLDAITAVDSAGIPLLGHAEMYQLAADELAAALDETREPGREDA